MDSLSQTPAALVPHCSRRPQSDLSELSLVLDSSGHCPNGTGGTRFLLVVGKGIMFRQRAAKGSGTWSSYAGEWCPN